MALDRTIGNVFFFFFRSFGLYLLEGPLQSGIIMATTTMQQQLADGVATLIAMWLYV